MLATQTTHLPFEAFVVRLVPVTGDNFTGPGHAKGHDHEQKHELGALGVSEESSNHGDRDAWVTHQTGVAEHERRVVQRSRRQSSAVAVHFSSMSIYRSNSDINESRTYWLSIADHTWRASIINPWLTLAT